ncbi:MAG: zinc finger MYND domain-containing protein [Nitrosomonas sp.]|nr:zinc finger MYND domain-containing protein [Nitrosomonas sp.]
MESKGSVLPFRFWITSAKFFECFVCKKEHKTFFLGLRCVSICQNKLEIRFVFVCQQCAQADIKEHIPFGQLNMVNLLMKHIEKLAAAFERGVQKVIDENKNDILATLGKAREAGCEHCKKPAKAQCSNCHLMRYCSIECNKAQWDVHKKQCKNITENSLFLNTIVLK